MSDEKKQALKDAFIKLVDQFPEIGMDVTDFLLKEEGGSGTLKIEITGPIKLLEAFEEGYDNFLNL